MEPVLDWEARYHEPSVPWERGGLNPAFEQWRQNLSQEPGAAVIPGCGRSPELFALADMGWQVTGVDLSPTAVDFQRRQLAASGLAGRVLVGNLFQWRPERPVDLVYEQTCLCAINPDDWSAYEAQLHAWLRPGGALLALFMQTSDPDGPPFHCSLEQMRGLFRAERWHWQDGSLRSEHPLGLHELGCRLTRL